MLVWTDLETTGLDPKKCSVLEVACIVTDDKLEEVARFQRVIYYPDAEKLAHLRGDEPEDAIAALSDETGIHPRVVVMHAKNGLWDACAKSPHTRDQVDEELAAFLKSTSAVVEVYVDDAGEKKTRRNTAQLAGSTISFDRGFMASDLPKALAELHYRNVDVTTLNELARRFWPSIHKTRPVDSHASHRGMADIEESLAVCKHYLASLAPVAPHCACEPDCNQPAGHP